MKSISTLPQWQQLATLRDEWRERRVSDAIAADPTRITHCQVNVAGITLDYSRQRIDPPVMDALLDLANARGLPGAIDAMWKGDCINNTEQRPALHIALRAEQGDAIASSDIVDEAIVQRQRMLDLADAIRSGAFSGPGNKPFQHIVHIGIGGSHLGPALALDALDDEQNGPIIHFLSNTDFQALRKLLRQLPKRETLIVLVSKSFTTAETMINADSVIEHLCDGRTREDVIRDQVVAVSANPDAMNAYGVPEARQLRISDWVGGRYSLWSSVGLPIAIRLGRERFMELLAGARAMDRHFRETPLQKNFPVLLAMIGIWNINFFDSRAHGVLPFAQAFDLLPDYLQQLEMESNGKQVDRDGNAVDYRTCPLIWGGVGMNGQHAFFQQLHQGTGWFSLDFVLVDEQDPSFSRQVTSIKANALAQMEALTRGRGRKDISGQPGDTDAETGKVLPYQLLPGNRPCSMIMLETLDAFRLGALLAAYEHKVYCQAVIWNLNPFDQFGVEFGKTLARPIAGALDGETLPESHDAVTRHWVNRLKHH